MYDQLLLGAQRLQLELSETGATQLIEWAEELLRWNSKVNLTAITDRLEVVEKHLLDSLAVLPEVVGDDLLDLGAGAGLPGLPLAVARPSMKVTMVDGVSKKVAFMKSSIVKLGFVGRVRAVHLHAKGAPAEEQLPRCHTVVARALMDVDAWLKLATPYALNRVIAMVAQPDRPALEALSARAGVGLTVREYRLPFSGDPRAVVVFHVKQ